MSVCKSFGQAGLLVFLSLLLSACLGGGGGSDGVIDSGGSTSTAARLSLIPEVSHAVDQIVLTAILKDADNAPLEGQSVSFRFLNDNSETLSPASAATGPDGTASVTVTDIGGNGGQAIVQVLSNGLSAQAQVNFAAQLDDSVLTLTSSDDYLLPGQTNYLHLQLFDSAGLPVVGQTLNLSASGQAALSLTSAQTDSNGVVKLSLTDSVAETVVVTVQAGTAQLQHTLYFGATLSLSAAQTSAQSGSVLPLTLQLRDAQGAGIVGAPINLNSPNGGALLSAFRVVTDEQGRAEVEVSAAQSGEALVEARAGELPAAQIGFWFDAAVSAISLSSPATALPTRAETDIELTLRDAAGQPLANTAFSVSASAGVLSDVPTSTDAQGVARFTLSHDRAEQVTLNVQSAGQSQSLNLYFGASLELLPVSSSTSDGEITLQALLKDGERRPLGGQPVSFQFVQSNGATLEPGSATTNADGTAEVTVRNLSGADTRVQVMARSGQISATAEVLFTDTHPQTALSKIQAAADASVLPAGSSATVRARLFSGDAPAANRTISVSASGNAQLASSSVRSGTDGWLSFLVSDPRSENVVVTLSDGNVSATVPLYFGANLSLIPAQASATGSITLQALLKDGLQSPLAGQTVRFSLADPAATETLSAAEVITDSAGVAEVELRDLGNDGGTPVVIARSGLLSGAQSEIKFLAEFASDLTLLASSSASVLNVGDSAVIQVQVQDKTGLPIVGQPVSFLAEGSAQLSAAEGVTDDNGLLQIDVSDAVAENIQLTVRAGTASQVLKLHFGASLRLSPEKTNGIAGGSLFPVTLTADMRDFDGAGIPGIAVNFRTGIDNKALLSAYQLVTDELGRVQVQVSNTQTEESVITAKAGTLTEAQSQIDFRHAGGVSSIELEADKYDLSLNDETTIRATVTDENGYPVKAGEIVNFRIEPEGMGGITQVGFTDEQGRAEVQFNAGTVAGIATVIGSVSKLVTVTGDDGKTKISSINFEAGVNLAINPEQAGDIRLQSIRIGDQTITHPDDAVLGVVGGSFPQSALLAFEVTDRFGNPIADATPIDFSLSSLGGGENILVDITQSGALNASTTTQNGLAYVTLRSGIVSGQVSLTAKAAGLSTVARFSIVGGKADAERFSLAADYLNIAGGITYGLEDNITAFVADRYGNVVADGTPVNFISEGGIIGTSAGSGAFTATTSLGRAQAILQSAAPTTPNLGGLPPHGNVGLNKIVAYTRGSESFIDSNGNGVYDTGESHSDLGEPYIDANDSGAFEAGELYIDGNGNGRFDPEDGIFQSDTLIWTAMNILFSGSIDSAVSVTANPAAIPYPSAGQSNFYIGFRVDGIGDIYGNRLVAGTRLQVNSTLGTLSGATDMVLGDGNGGAVSLGFGVSGTYTDKVQSGEVSLTITPPGSTGAPITIILRRFSVPAQ